MSICSSLVAEIVCKAVLLVFTLGIYFFIPPFQYNMVWTEADRKRPYLPESVPVWSAGLIMFLCGLLCIIFMVITNSRLCKNKFGTKFGHPFFAYCGVPLLSLGSCLLFTWAAVEPIKRFIAEPRPHFLALCYGGVDNIPPLAEIPMLLTNERCLDKAMKGNIYSAHEKFADMTEKKLIKYLNESRLSFPSAHSAFVSTTFFWTALYVRWCTMKLKVPSYNAIGAVVLVAFITPTIFVASSRIRDFWHYWWDVLVGLIIGPSIAAWQFFEYQKSEIEEADRETFANIVRAKYGSFGDEDGRYEGELVPENREREEAFNQV